MRVILFFLCFLLLLKSVAWAGEKVEVNQADAVQLASALEGIGQKKAQKIVDWRNEHGAIKSLAVFASIPGIGKKLAERNKDWLVFDKGALTTGSNANHQDKATAGLSLPVRAYTPR